MIDVTRHSLFVPFLPPDCSGLRVVQLSDLHCGRFTSDRVLQEGIARVVDHAPDLVLLTGDFVTDDPADIEACMGLLAPLMQPGLVPLGVHAVPGNHDKKVGWPLVQNALEQAGVACLCNQSVRLENRLWIVGLDEDWFGTPDPVRAFADVPDEAPVLVLAHNPGEADLVANRRCVVFAGHTHGGQIWLPLLTKWVLRWIKAKHYRAGWYTAGNARLYVNRGLGNADVPFRFRCPPEVAFFTLHSEEIQRA